MVLEMQEAPDLNTRIGECNINTVAARLVEGLLDVRMLVAIKNYPDRVVFSEAITSFELSLPKLRRGIDKRNRRTHFILNVYFYTTILGKR